jgi:hypothetical protein
MGTGAAEAEPETSAKAAIEANKVRMLDMAPIRPQASQLRNASDDPTTTSRLRARSLNLCASPLD